MLVRLDHPGGGALDQHRVDLFLGHRAATGFLDTQQAQQGAGGHRQQHHERLGGHGQHVDRSCNQACESLWMRLSDALGHEFTHDDRKIRDRQHHQTRGGVPSLGRRDAQTRQPDGQWAGQRGFANDAVEHTDGSDANLDGGQKPRRVLSQFDRGLGRSVALIHELLQPCLACGDQCDLRHGKQAVEEDESEKYGDFHREYVGDVESRPSDAGAQWDSENLKDAGRWNGNETGSWTTGSSRLRNEDWKAQTLRGGRRSPSRNGGACGTSSAHAGQGVRVAQRGTAQCMSTHGARSGAGSAKG